MLQSAQIKLDFTKAHGFCPEDIDIQGPEYLLLEQSPGHAQGIGVSDRAAPLFLSHTGFAILFSRLSQHAEE